MNLINNIFDTMKKSGFFILLGLLTFYFFYYILLGDRGFLKREYLKHKIEIAQINKQKYALKKKDLQRKVAMLSEESLDLDYLEERTRIVLNMLKSNEYIILDKDTPLSH